MAKNGDRITTTQIYRLVDETRKELAERIDNIEKKVDTVTIDVSNIRGRIAVFASVISVAIGAFYFVINLFVKK